MMHEATEVDGVKILRILEENFDASVASQIREDWLPTLRDNSAIVVDCQCVEFADSAALGLVLKIQTTVGADRLALSGVGQRLALCLTRLPQYLRPSEFNSTESAVDVFANLSSCSDLPQQGRTLDNPETLKALQ